MTIHLIKLSVGVSDVAHLRSLQAHRLHQFGEVFHRTRMWPRREAELLAGGSIYWVIRGNVSARQRVIGLKDDVDSEGLRRCRLQLDPDLVETQRLPHRAFQGWRYLDPAAAPADIAESGGGGDQLPEAMIEELRRLGLW